VFDVAVDGATAWAAGLGRDMSPAFKAITVGVAAALQNELAPYPPAPAASGKRWYERGYGTKYRRKDGSITGRKTSQMLGRSWSIASPSAIKAVLMNRASYSALVHASEDQTRRHASTGWQTEETAAANLERSGVVVEIAEQAIANVLKVG
jgi:hypothetical protein